MTSDGLHHDIAYSQIQNSIIEPSFITDMTTFDAGGFRDIVDLEWQGGRWSGNDKKLLVVRIAEEGIV